MATPKYAISADFCSQVGYTKPLLYYWVYCIHYTLG